MSRLGLLLLLRRVTLRLAVVEAGIRPPLAGIGRRLSVAGDAAALPLVRLALAVQLSADRLAVPLLRPALAAAGVEARLAAGPAGAAVRRVYGTPRGEAFDEGLRDLAAWVGRDRVGLIGLLWLIALLATAALGGPAAVAQAAQLTYLLLALLGLHLLVVDTAQPSLGHAAFLAIGAYGMALLRNRLGLGGLPAAVVAAGLAALLGYALGFGAARLRPAFVALATWAFGWLLAILVDAFPQATGGAAGITLMGPLRLRLAALGIDAGFDATAHLVLGTLLVAATLILMRSAERSTVGLGWAAMRDSAALSRALGIDVAAHRRRAFAVGAGIAGLAGALGAQAVGVVDPTSYTATVSLALFVAVLIGSPFGRLGPFVGLLVTRGLPAALNAAMGGLGFHVEAGSGIFTALLTMAALVVVLGRGRRLESWLRRRRPAPAAGSDGATAAGGTSEAAHAVAVGGPAEGHAVAGQASDEEEAEPARQVPALEARGLTLRFEGVLALDHVAIAVNPGEIHGLIGPNGSGKSTLLRCLSGTLRPDAGNVALEGRLVDGLDEVARVRAGIARSFQRTVVLPELTVAEHVELGLALDAPATSWIQALAKTPAYREQAARRRQAALTLLEIAGLAEHAEADAETLSGGRQRLLQVITAAAGGPSVLLLDEPAAGMRPDELALLERTLRRLARYGITLVVVEHNLRWLSRVATRMTVLREGQVIAVGAPIDVAADPQVRRAYLGSVPPPVLEPEPDPAPRPVNAATRPTRR